MDTPERFPEDPQDRLESWKEIAAYLGRDVRTAQRWEKGEGLPVHRHLHDKQGSVYAFRGELEEWRQGRSLPPGNGVEEDPPLPDPPAPEEPLPQAIPAKAAKGKRWGMSLSLLGAAGLAGSLLLFFRSDLRRASSVPSVAVLPFANLSGDEHQEYLSEGLTEELITQLGRQEGERCRVVALRSLMAFRGTPKRARQIAAELGADFFLEGSFRRSGDRVRVAVHLVRARDEAHLWDESYDRDLKDLLNLQSEVAESIAVGIGQKLARRSLPPRAPRTLHPQAYEAHLRGRFHWNRRTPADLIKALESFQRASRLDPTYAPSLVGIADCLTLLGSAEMGAMPSNEAMPQAKRAVLQALALDGDLAEAHATLAHLKLVFDWDRAGAEREFRRALELNPGSATAHQWFALLLMLSGRSEEGLEELGKAESLDPRSPIVQCALSEASYFARSFEAAESYARRALDLDPAFLLGQVNLGRALVMQGRHDEAVAVFQTAREMSGQAPGLTMLLGWAWAEKGDLKRARDMLAALHHPPVVGGRPMYVPAVFFAALHGALRDRDAMMADLDRALKERCDYLIYLSQDPMADKVRGDARFAALVQAVGFT